MDEKKDLKKKQNGSLLPDDELDQVVGGVEDGTFEINPNGSVDLPRR